MARFRSYAIEVVLSMMFGSPEAPLPSIKVIATVVFF